jgi:hypothetical protein
MGLSINVWEVRLSELADYRKIYGHCTYNEQPPGGSQTKGSMQVARKDIAIHNA